MTVSREEHDALQIIARSSPAAIMLAPAVPATAAARRDELGAGAGAGAAAGDTAGDVAGAGVGVLADVLGAAASTAELQPCRIVVHHASQIVCTDRSSCADHNSAC